MMMDVAKVAIDPIVYARNNEWVVHVVNVQTTLVDVSSPKEALLAHFNDNHKFTSRRSGRKTEIIHW